MGEAPVPEAPQTCAELPGLRKPETLQAAPRSFWCQLLRGTGPNFPSRSWPSRGSDQAPNPWEPGTLALAAAARAGPSSGRGTQCGSGRLAGLPGPTPAGPRPRDARTTRKRGGPPSQPLPTRPPAGPYLAPGPGATSSRGRRGPARGEGRSGDGGSRGQRLARLPRFRQSGVEHSASPSRANEEDSHGNSTTYLRARNDRACLDARGLAAAQTRGRAGLGAALGTPGPAP